MSTTSTLVQNLVEIPPWGASWHIGEIYPQFLFMPLFFSDSPTGKTACQIFMLNGLNNVDVRKGVPSLAFIDIAVHLWGQIALKRQFWGRE